MLLGLVDRVLGCFCELGLEMKVLGLVDLHCIGCR